MLQLSREGGGFADEQILVNKLFAGRQSTSIPKARVQYFFLAKNAQIHCVFA